VFEVVVGNLNIFIISQLKRMKLQNKNELKHMWTQQKVENPKGRPFIKVISPHQASS
jgi:hypothetical protein